MTNTGNERSNNNAVIPTAQTNKGIRSALILIGFILIIVEIKFTAPRIEDTPKVFCRFRNYQYTMFLKDIAKHLFRYSRTVHSADVM